MNDWSTERLDDLMDRYLFGLLDEAAAARVRRKIESDPEWQLAYEEAARRKRTLAQGVRHGAAEAAATRAPLSSDVLAAGKGVERRRSRRRRITHGVLGGLAAAAVIMIGICWLQLLFVHPPVRTVRLIGQTDWLAGSTVSLRALVTRTDGAGEAGVPVVLATLDPTSGRKAPVVLAEWVTDALGSAAGSITVPDWPSGKTTLVVRAGRRRVSTVHHPITIRRAARIYLATDKPIYKPGQTLHMRCLALRKPSLRPMAGEHAKFTVVDPAGNTIFREEKKLSDYGIASADLPTDPLISPGRYDVKASVGDDTSTQTVEIFHYKLPAFSVKLRFDRPYYLPGQTVTGRVELRYHFGKPVAGGKVNLKLTARAIPGRPDALDERAVTTDREGKASFSFRLPRKLFGSRRTGGDAHLLLSARATDTAGQENTGYATVAVAEQDIRIAAVAEDRIPASGVESRVFIVTSYPDGRPAETIVAVESVGRSLRTDAAGAAVLSGAALPDTLRIFACDARGLTGRAEVSLPAARSDTMILRTDRPIYQAGETIRVEVIAPNARQVFLDVVKDRQTMLTRALSIENGRGSLALDLGQQLVGTLQLHAYRLSAQSEWVGRDVLIIVRPARRLRVAVQADREVYQPGRDARLTFLVTDPAGKAAPAALSLAAVDEAVFSVQQAAPGFEQTLLGLDAELLEPAVQAGFSPLLLPESDNYARAALAACLVPSARAPGRPSEVAAGPHSLDFDSRPQAWSAYRGRKDRAENIAAASTVMGGLALLVLLIGWAFIKARTSFVQVLLIVMVLAFLAPLLLPVLSSGVYDARQYTGEDAAGLVREVAAVFSADLYVPTDDSGRTGAAGTEVRVRTYFPETMLWRPQVITDESGRATLTFPLADSITTWRLSGTAVSRAGKLGTIGSSIRVFQPFFVDVDAPGRLTRGDEVSVPLVLYNYSRGALTVSLKAEAEAGLSILEGREQSVRLTRGEVKRAFVRIRADEIGGPALTIRAAAGGHADAIRRALRVEPPGVPRSLVVNGALTDQAQEVQLEIPEDAVGGSVTVRMKVYPSTFSELLDGLEGIVRMPHGCFEQTSSTTYPNVMALAYMHAHGLARAEVLAKAGRYVQLGYQRLITFEVRGGGFSLYGQAPANVPLTAYGLMEFADMARVHNVDPRILKRTADWLVARRNGDGSWGGHLPMSHGTGQGRLAATAYVTWAIATCDIDHSAVGPSAAYVAGHIDQARDAHTLALCANALLAVNKQDKAAHRALARLAAMARRGEPGERYWAAAGAPMAYCRGASAEVETTALAALALLNAPEHRLVAVEALRWLSARRDAHGTWGTTQSTVLALKALLAGADVPVKRRRQASVAATWSDASGKPSAARLVIVPRAATAVHTVRLEGLNSPGTHRVRLTSHEASGMAYQFAVRYHTLKQPAPEPAGPLSIRVTYDRTHLSANDTVRVRATVTNNTAMPARMLLADIGTPPGFVVRPAGLDKLKAAGKIDRYTLTARGVIVYVRVVPPKAGLEITYDMTALIPLKAAAAPTTVYAYYDPQSRAVARPARFTVE